MPHPDLAAEQAHVDHAYDRLEAMRAAAAEMLRAAFGERGGTFQAVTERDIRVRTSLNRLEQLQLGQAALVFGRIDRTDPRRGPGHDEAFHIGRLAVSDEDQEPLVVDWRAPVAEPFYRATGAHPMGLTRRRHFLAEGRRLIDLEDELFGEEGGSGRVGLGLTGPAVLLAALERSRTGRMRDIVATVQREQDEIIRGPLAGILVVQGGPGTGKTAVALHRAAYLLYTHRFPLERQGVLVVGPNPLFLRYIEQVLPSLGETGVELSTVGRLSGIRATGTEARVVGRLKGDPRMAQLLARAVADRERPLRRAVDVPYGRHILRVSRRASIAIVAAARRRAGPHNARRRLVEELLWRELHARLAAAEARGPRLGGADGPVGGVAVPNRIGAGDGRGGAAADDGQDGGAGVVEDPADDLADEAADGLADDPADGLAEELTAEELTADELGRELRRLPQVSELLDRMWPVLSPQQLLHDLFGAPPLVALAARGLLREDEQALLHRVRSRSPDEVAWTEADLALLDEARALLGPVRRRPRAADVVRSYGHIVVDEAQDLSPMQLRMLGRRSLSGSMTVVGDIAQATGDWAPASWADVLHHLPARRAARVTELTVNYRTPSEIMDLAGRVLQVAAPGMRPPESVRATGVAPRFVPAVGAGAGAGGVGAGAGVATGGDAGVVAGAGAGVAAGGGAGVAAVAAWAARVAGEEAAVILGESAAGGSVAVIGPPSWLGHLAEALASAGLEFGTVSHGALDATVSLLPVDSVKGLEFDSVVVVEPAAIVEEAAQALRSLYVALTRATRRLSVVYSSPLPEPLVT